MESDEWFIRLPDRSRHGTRIERSRARTTKGRRSREFPVHRELRTVLDEIPRHADQRIFHGPRGGKLKPDTVRNVLRDKLVGPLTSRFPARSDDEPSFKDGRLHSFRHYFCSACANNGVPELMLMNWLGHRESKMVKRYYHPDRERAAQVMQRIKFAPDENGAA